MIQVTTRRQRIMILDTRPIPRARFSPTPTLPRPYPLWSSSSSSSPLGFFPYDGGFPTPAAFLTSPIPPMLSRLYGAGDLGSRLRTSRTGVSRTGVRGIVAGVEAGAAGRALPSRSRHTPSSPTLPHVNVSWFASSAERHSAQSCWLSTSTLISWAWYHDETSALPLPWTAIWLSTTWRQQWVIVGSIEPTHEFDVAGVCRATRTQRRGVPLGCVPEHT